MTYIRSLLFVLAGIQLVLWPVKNLYLQRLTIYRLQLQSTRVTFSVHSSVRQALVSDQRRPDGVATLPVLAPPSRREVSRRTVAIGCATTSKGIDLKDLSVDLLLNKHLILHRLLPSFCYTASKSYYYHLYLSYDHTDEMFTNPNHVVLFLRAFDHVLKTRCLHHGVIVSVHLVEVPYTGAPTWAQNDAMMEAYLDNMEYYYRINDDTIMITRDWTESYIEALNGTTGVAGPQHKGGNMTILTYDFVHHTHLEIFGFYYPRLFTDIMADTWMTRVYSPLYSSQLADVTLRHTTEFGTRYKVSMNKTDARYFRELRLGRAVLKRYVDAVKVPVKSHTGHVVSISLYGQSPTMTFGAIRQAQLMRVVYPGWSLRVYVPESGKDQVPSRVLKKLQILGAEVFKVNSNTTSTLIQSQWRLLAALDKSVRVLLVRDAHRHISICESKAVTSWLKTNWPYHCIRDLESHQDLPIVPALWGAKLHLSAARQIVSSILASQHDTAESLAKSLYTKSSRKILYHDRNKHSSGSNVLHLEPVDHRNEFPVGQMFSEHMVPYSSPEDLARRMQAIGVSVTSS